MMITTPRIENLTARAFRVPTDQPESDGTLAWSSTTLVLVEASAGGATGLGYTYADAAAVPLIRGKLAEVVRGEEAFDVPRLWQRLRVELRNLGVCGLAAMAISAVDLALWDLKARILEQPLAALLGRVRDAVPIYGSGGFTSYGIDRLQAQLRGWVAQGIPRVKMKVGRHPEQDLARVRAARGAIGPEAELFVDANGAYTVSQALLFAQRFAEQGVRWFEEPVSSAALEELQALRARMPAGMALASGEYSYVPSDLLRLLEPRAVDVLQADITRCLGVTGFLQAGALCEAFDVPLSGHTAPAAHLHAAAALPRLVHLEYFWDHVRIERLLFDGVPVPEAGALRPDLSRPGNGLELKSQDAEQFAM